MNSVLTSLRLCGFARHLFLLCILSSPALAQKNATIPNPDPELERKTFILAPGLEVNLFAEIPKPIQMNWDARGRLWVATSETYPQIKPGEAANDKILILEDTDGDGKADKTDVFADGQLIPTGLLPGDGGCYVANSTEILHLTASKPGGKADKRRVVLSGFGTEDTHHLIHTFRWGPDGAMYFNQSVYIHSHVETPHGTVRLNGGGIWRYEPRTQKLEVFARGFWNPWGLAFDKYGTLFATDGANGEGIVHVVPGASYPTGGNQAPRVLHGLNPGSPKFCGLEIVSGRHFPDDWAGDLITNDFRGHRVCRFKLRDDGSTFESRELEEVIKSNHAAFRPVDCLMGPDGALYIADWYNPIIQHGEVDFRDPRRDKTHGRIWRVTAKGRPLVGKPKLFDAKAPDLLNYLNSPEDWTRQMARQQITSIDPGIVHAEALNILEVRNTKDLKLRLELAWLLQSIDRLHMDEIKPIVRSEDAGIRAAGVRMMWLSDVAWPNSDVEATEDPSIRVRLEAVNACKASPTPQSVSALLKMLEKPVDPTLIYAITLAIQESKGVWLPAFIKGKFGYGNDMKKLAFALEAVQSPESITPLLKLLQEGKIPDAQRTAAWVLVAKLGDALQLEQALVYATSASAGEGGLEILDAIVHSARVRKISPNMFAIQTVLNSPNHFRNPNSVPQKCKLIGLWKIETERKNLEGIVQSPGAVPPGEDKTQALAQAKAALEGLAILGGKASHDYLAWIAGEDVPPPMSAEGRLSMGEPDRVLRKDSLLYLIPLDATRAAKLAVVQMNHSPAFTSEIISAFLQQKNGAAILAKATAPATLSTDTAKLALRTVKAAGNPSPTLIAAIAKAGKIDALKKVTTVDDLRSLTSDVATKADAFRGETVFRRKELQCFNCHAIGGTGGAVGPDLTSIGASAQVDYLVESLLVPNKAIKEGYHTVDVTTLAGKIITGIKLREANGELVLRDKDDREVTLRLDDIDTRRVGRSLMPDDTTEPLTRAEFLDLVRFLSELGKVGPYEPSKAKLVRKWEVINPTNETMAQFRRERLAIAAEKPANLAWSTVYSRVAGSLPFDEIPSFTVWSQSGPQSAVKFRIQVSTAGELKWKLNSLQGLTAYLESAPVPLDKPIPVSAGEQYVTLLIDRTKAAKELRMELDESSTARATIVNGK